MFKFIVFGLKCFHNFTKYLEENQSWQILVIFLRFGSSEFKKKLSNEQKMVENGLKCLNIVFSTN